VLKFKIAYQVFYETCADVADSISAPVIFVVPQLLAAVAATPRRRASCEETSLLNLEETDSYKIDYTRFSYS
jgi:hypothetical protein